jgi:YD repeat-containing protein
MVAVVSGSGLGLFNSSASSLSGDNNSNAQVGRGRDRYYVNTTTGNLIVQATDETLSAIGLDFVGVRTYNSQGTLDEDNGDQWRLNVHMRLSAVTGGTGVNTAGSRLTKTFGDGAEVVYTYNTTRARYESTDGDGANDFLTWNGSVWTWTDGSSRVTEEYASIGGVQRIRFARDTDGLVTTYNYTGSLLTSINLARPNTTDANNVQTVTFTYNGTNLASIGVSSYNGTAIASQTLTRYFYDSSNRLRQVVVDLTPADNTAPLPDANGDGLIEGTQGQTYITTYTYDGTSKRVASITQSDGSSVAFTYQDINGNHRLRTVTDGEGRVTTFTYTEVIGGGGGGTPVAAPANTAVLSNQDTVNLPRIDAALTTNATQTTPHARIDGALSTTDTQLNNYTRNDSALTTPSGSAGSWAPQVTLGDDFWDPPSYSYVRGMDFDANGNGFALISTVNDTWDTATLLFSRYTRATNSWSVPTSVASYFEMSGFTPDPHEAKLAVDAAGNALVVWNHPMEAGVLARRYNAATNTWISLPQLPAAAGSRVSSIALHGTRALVVTQDSSSNISAHRLSADAWQTAASGGVSYFGTSAAIDDQGNASVVFSRSPTSFSQADMASMRYTAATSSWGAVETRESLPAIAQYPSLGFDAAGNGLAVWTQGSTLMSARYTRATNSWSAATTIATHTSTINPPKLAIDAAGNAIVGWTQFDNPVNSGFVRVYNAASATWGAVTALESSTGHVDGLQVDINGNRAVAVWAQEVGGVNDVLASTFNGTSWTATTIDGWVGLSALDPYVAIDSSGHASAMWGWSGNTFLGASRFTAGSGGGSPYYTVPSGATWQSTANAVYGINSAAAGSALQTALGNPALTTGAQLTGFPAQLSVTTTVTVPPYYAIPGGATWQSIANTVYGVNSAAAGSALQSAMGNPALTTGTRLTNFPATLSVTSTLAPHYLVPAGATWQSIANALFGSSANNSTGASALQTALGNPSIASGQRLFNIPATLGVSTTVPWYYVVQAGNTWSGITQAIYGTTDANAIAALQAAVGTTTLTVGARLTVPNPLNYTAGGTGGPSIYQRTTVLDALGITTTYTKDAQGRLLSVVNPAGETRYTYDPVTGNVQTIAQDPNGLNRVTTFGYDPNTGLLTSTRDSLGNTVTRTYTASNQLETETSYLVRDPDGAGSGAPASPLVKRFIYDGEQHLRFAISADGRVTEHVYNANGERTTTYTYAAATYAGAYTEAALASWAVTQRGGALELIEYVYDFRNNISLIKKYATTSSSGAGTGSVWQSRFVYDQRGQLISTIDTYGEASATANDYLTTYTYDGLGRAQNTSTWVSGGETSRLVKGVVYLDAARQTVTSFAGGLTKTETFNRAGELTSVVMGPGAFGDVTYTYDANGRERVVKDQTGVRTFCFYDDAGRKIGYVAGDGALTEYVYNRANQVVKTIRYATLLSGTTMTSLTGGAWSTVAFSALRTEANTAAAANQIARNVYDASGKLVYTLEQVASVTATTFENVVTQSIYDGAGRLTDQIRFFNKQTFAASIDELLPAAISVAAHASDRRTRYFYNGDGQLTGTLDGAGYLKENLYDAAGRLAATIGYYNASDASRWVTGTLDTLRPGSAGSTAQLDPARDIRTRFFYDAQGRKIGELDGERYLTEFTFDVATNVRQTIRYNRVLTDPSGTATFAALKAEATAAPAVTTHVTRYTYDGLGQLLTETNFENTETLYSYDIAGNLIATTRANNVSAEARTTRQRYDVLGRLTHELSAEGAVALAALPANATQEQINAVWNNFGIAYGYDNAGRRISATVRPSDSQTSTTYFYYDNQGRVRFELDPLGRVTENRYNALGQLVDKLTYWRSITPPGQLGGLLTPALVTALSATESANVHERTTYGYSLRGEITSTLTAAGASTTNAYNVFGELRLAQAGTQTGVEYTYDARGHLRTVIGNGVTLETRSYDAFGRLATVLDNRGNTTTTTFDRLGREVTSIETGDASSTLLSYDAFSRVLTSRDKLLNTTSYLYDDAARTLRITTPENAVSTITHNRHGENVNIVDGVGNSITYVYDVNGRLTRVYDSVGEIEGHSYDRAGREIETRDARGVATRLEYDAASRLLRRTVDSAAGGLQLVTTFAFDANARVLTVTEPGGRVTRTEYDRDGRVAFLYVDYGGPAQRRTDYTYDAANNELTVTEFAGSSLPRRTRYVYDSFGRRTDEYVADGALNLRTQYRYDANGNVTRVIDSRGVSSWYVYDVQGRRTHSIDGAGGVTQSTYDAEDRVIATRAYTAALSAATLTTLAGLDSPTTASFTVTNSANDRVDRTFFDRDGRAAYGIDGVGTVTQRSFDANGNVTRLRRISALQLTGSYADAAAVTAALGAAAATLAVADQVSWTAYDLRGRAEFAIDSMNGVHARVVRYTYDVSDNVIAQREYFTARALSTDNTLATLRNWDAANALAADDHVTLFWYDTLDRQRFVLDAEGYLTESRFNDTTRASQVTRYAVRPSGVTSGSTLAQVAGAVATNAADETTVTWVDATDRVRFVLDAEGFLTETQYNDGTGAVTQVAYAARPTGTPAISTTLATMVSSRTTTAARDRATTTWVDAANRQRFVLDAEGYLTETRYNDTTGSKTVLAYLTRQSQFTAASTLASLTAANAITVHADDQSTREDFDAAGRLSQVTDSLSRSEYYAYDGTGSKTRFVNKKGASLADAAYAWTYEYDANGRLTRELSPSVTTLTVTESGGTFTATSVTGSLVTRTTYDFFGNITSRIEADNIPAQSRTTSWEYDALGRQITTISPAVGIYDPAAGDLQTGGTTAVARTEFNWRTRSEVAYDVFGNAFRNRRTFVPEGANPPGAPADIYSYKAYDKLNRVVFDVDNKNQVTRRTLDAFGNEIETRLYATARATTAPLPATGLGPLRPSLVTTGLTTDDATDRRITKTYDRMNRVLTTRQPAAWSYVLLQGSAGAYVQTQPTVENSYDAFGDLVRMRELVLDGAPQTWATAYKYHDRRGAVVGQVDAGGYYTSFTYDALGNLKSKSEYAQKNTGTINETSFGTVVPSANGAALGSDRITSYGYDRLNRLVSETRVNFEYSNPTGSSTPSFTTAGSPAYIKYGYDALGNQTRLEDALGGVTYTFYDVLGRVTAIASPLRDRGEGAAVMGYARMERDAHGVLARQTDYYNGLAASAIGAGDAPALPTAPAADAVNDRVSTIASDKAGNALAARDAVGAVRYTSYNERGDIAKEWQPVLNVNSGVTETRVTIYRYDAAGQLTQKQESQRAGVAPVVRHQQYNAFGEITLAYNAGAPAADQEFFHYDQQGRVWRTNGGDGVDKILMYNLAGLMTLEIRSQNRDLANGAWTNASAAINALNSDSAANVMRTETVYDLRGKPVEERLPGFDNAVALPPATTSITGGVNTSFTLNPNDYRIYWTPAALGQRAYFGYRLAGTTDTFTEVWVEKPSSTLHGVNMNTLDNRLYEYRIAYYGGLDPMAVSETTGTFQLTRTVTTTGNVTLDPPDAASQIPSVIGTYTNGIVSWAAPPTAAMGTNFRAYFTVAGTQVQATLSGGTLRADLTGINALRTAGTHTYTIEHWRDGVLVGRNTGSLTSDGIQTTITSSNPLNFALPTYNTPIVSPQVVSGGQIAAQVISVETSYVQWGVPGRIWEGWNHIELQWLDIGAGAIRVEIDYDIPGHFYFEPDPNNPSEGNTPYYPGFQNFTKVFDFGSGATGATLRWQTGILQEWGSFENFRAARVKRLINGVWTTILSQATPPASVGRSMSWTAPAQPIYEDGNITPRFEYRLNSTGGYTAITPSFNGTFYGVNLNGFAVGNYDYILSYVLADGRVLARQTGTFSFTAAALTLTSTPVNTNFPAEIIVPTVNTTLKRLEWTRAKNDPNDRIVVKYTTPFVTGSQEFFVTAIAGANGLWYVDLNQLPAMTNREVRWEVKYYGGPTQTDTSYARIWFAHNLTISVPAQPTLRITSQSALFPSQATQMSVPAFRASDRSLFFTAPAAAAADVRFRLNAGLANEMLLTAVAEGGGYRVFLPAVMPHPGVLGRPHEWVVELRNGSGQLYGTWSGDLSLVTTLGPVTGQNVTRSTTVRPDNMLDVNVNVGIRPIVDPPNAVYSLAAGDPNGEPPTLDYPELGAAPWASATTVGGGGWVRRPEQIAGLAWPFDHYEHLSSSQYNYYDNHQTIYWDRDDRTDYEYAFEYWPSSNPAAVQSLNVVGPSISYWAVDIHGLAANTYGWRITRRHAGSPIVLGVREGTFTRGATNSVTTNSPVFAAGPTLRPVNRQEFDRWGNVVKTIDAAGNETRFRFNSLNRLVTVTEAADLVFDRRLQATGVAPTAATQVQKRNYYDLLGRLIETQDGYDQANRVTYNLAGQALTQRNADAARFGNAVSRNVYDVFGNITQTVDQLGYITKNKYDAAGRLVEVWREIELDTFTNKTLSSDFTLIANGAARIQKTTYVYDAAGRRVRETNNANEVTSYHYDLGGNIVRRVQPGGATVEYVYDQYGNKIEETDQLGAKRAWTYDAFKRMQTHTELYKTGGNPVVNYVGGGLVVKYDYDQAGLVTFQRTIDGSGNPLAGGQNITLAYDSAGNLKTITDAAVNRVTSYRYDAAGRQARETVVVDGKLHQDTRVAYDAHNRVRSLSDPDYALNIVFDVNGNRAQLRSTYSDHENIDYEYDEMNRITRTVVDPGRELLWGQDSISEVYEYNARGERIRRLAIGRYWERRANGSYTFFPPVSQHNNPDPIEEQFFYDGLGRLKNHKRDLVTSTGKRKVDLHIYTYDAGSRVQTDHATNVEDDRLVLRKTTNFYLSDGRLDRQEIEKGNVSNVDAILSTSTTLEQRTTYGRSIYSTASADIYNGYSLGIDDAGNVRGYRVQIFGDNPYTTTYRTKFEFGDNYLEKDQRAESDVLLKRGTTTRIYNANHELIRFIDQGDSQSAPHRRRDLVNNQAGQILTALSGIQTNLDQAWDHATSGTAAQKILYWQNQQVGSFGTAEPNGLYTPKFDVNSTPISGYSDMPPSIVAQAGDTLRIIAGRVYGDSGLWYLIAHENGFTAADEAIPVGTQLRIPNRVYSLSNTSNSFRPFDAGTVLGDLTPTQRPKDLKCQTFSQILGMVVALVLMVVLTPTMGPVAAAAVGSAAGNLVSQYTFLMANGLYDWNQEWDGLRRSLGLKGNFWDAMGDLASEFGKHLIGRYLGIPIGAIDYWVNKDEPNEAQTTIYNPLGHGAGRRLDRRSVAISAAAAAATAAATQGASSALSSSPALTAGAVEVLSAGAGAVAGYAVTYGLNKAFGRDTHFSWRDVATSALASMAGAAAGQAASHPIASGIASRVASMSVEVLAGGKVDAVTFAADVFMNAMADSIQYQAAKSRAEKARDQMARAEMEAAKARQLEATYAASSGGPPGARVADPLDKFRRNPAFQAAIEKLGDNVQFVNQNGIEFFLGRSGFGYGAVGHLGEDGREVYFTAEELDQVAGFLKVGGIESGVANDLEVNLAAIVRKGTTMDEFSASVLDRLAGLANADDVASLAKQLRFDSSGRVERTDVLDLQPALRDVMGRFDQMAIEHPFVAETYAMLQKHNASGMAGHLAGSLGESVESMNRRYMEGAIVRAAADLEDQGYLPQDVKYHRFMLRGTQSMQLFLDGAANAVPVEKVLAFIGTKTFAALKSMRSSGRPAYKGEPIGGVPRMLGEAAEGSARTLPPPVRGLDELVPNGQIPGVRRGAFNRWFNELTPEEFNRVWAVPGFRKTIEARIREPKHLHEWLPVGRADTFKSWGVTMEQIKSMRTPTRTTEGVNPPWKHGETGSGTAHNEIIDLVDSARNFDEYRTSLQNWADRRLLGGRSSLPPGLRD